MARPQSGPSSAVLAGHGCMCSISRMQPRPSTLVVVPATRNWRKAQLSLRAPRAVVVTRPPPRLVRSDVLRLRQATQCSVTQLSVCALYRTSRSFSRKLISMWMRRFYLFNTKTSEMLFAHWSARICFAFGQTSCEGLTTSFSVTVSLIQNTSLPITATFTQLKKLWTMCVCVQTSSY